jgi:hypothetical protein
MLHVSVRLPHRSHETSRVSPGAQAPVSPLQLDQSSHLLLSQRRLRVPHLPHGPSSIVPLMQLVEPVSALIASATSPVLSLISASLAASASAPESSTTAESNVSSVDVSIDESIVDVSAAASDAPESTDESAGGVTPSSVPLQAAKNERAETRAIGESRRRFM